MSENLFDPKTFVVSSALSGQRGVIREASVIRHNYGGKAEKDSTAIRLVVESPALERPREIFVSMGGKLMPSEDRRTPSVSGPFLIGGKVDKGSNGADLLNAIQGSGFPMARLGEEGVDALVGAAFIWTAIEKMLYDKITKTRTPRIYDIPAKFEGYENEAAAPSAEDVELTAVVQAAVQQALEVESEIPRSQISLKVGPAFKDHPQRNKLLALLLKDTVLASIPGVSFDKKTLRKV